MKVELPIQQLFRNLEEYYLQKIQSIDEADVRDNVKISELENIMDMATYYKLDMIVELAQKEIERVINGR